MTDTLCSPDIVERLRKVAAVEKEVAYSCDCRPEHTANWQYALDCIEGADEIERLQAECSSLREANKTFADHAIHGNAQVPATAEEKELFAAATKIDVADAVKHIRNWMSYIDDHHRQKYADLIEAQAKLIAWFVERPRSVAQAHPDLPEFDLSSESSTDSLCAKCGCETKGEAALVDGQIWCHPCADGHSVTSKDRPEDGPVSRPPHSPTENKG